VRDRNALGLRGHTSYVQGVAWDPLNQMVVTQSADRSCRVHLVPRTLPLSLFIFPCSVLTDPIVETAARGGNGEARRQGSPRGEDVWEQPSNTLSL
jgi:WD40 repeat protein